MADNRTHFLSQNIVAALQAAPNAYSSSGELTSAFRELGTCLGWGAPSGAFEKVVPSGSKVLVKPNLVLHENNGPWSYDAVITHPAFIQCVVSELLQTSAVRVTVGDSPVQNCDFAHLLRRTKLDEWSENLIAREPRFTGIRDFRRTIATLKGGIRRAKEDMVDLSRYVLFDLGVDSLLEPITNSEPRFRITGYDPKFLANSHLPGRHQYLIAKDVLEADIIINLPKLKMHKKAGVTNALKNFVGINGNKEYLPHHRIGGSNDAGDCYPGKNRIKEALESLYDFQNKSITGSRAQLVAPVLRPLRKFLSIAGDETGIEGAWSGNDTVWRMSLDLNRILMYGCVDGSMKDTPQRRVLHVCDGIIAGQGDGPLAPEPFNLGFILASENAAAMDWVGAHFLGMDPEEVPIIRGAFGSFRWPLTQFASTEVAIRFEDRTYSVADFYKGRHLPQAKHVPPGWRSAVRRPA